MAVPVLLQKVVAKEGIKKLAVIYDQTQDAQAGDANVCKELASKLGYEIVAFEAFRAGDQDFSPQITKIRSLKPDAIYVAAATGDGIKVVSQIREAGIDKRLITGYGSFQDPVYWDGTRGVVKGDYTWLAQDLTSPVGAIEGIPRQYNARFTQQEATSFSTYGYDSVMVLMAALKKAGEPDRDKVAAGARRLRRYDLARHPHHIQEPAGWQQRQSLSRRHPDHWPRQLRGSLMRYASRVEGLTKRFGGLVAVNDVSFEVAGGPSHVDRRTERRRQDDGVQPDHRRAAGRPRRNLSERQAHHRLAAPQVGRARASGGRFRTSACSSISMRLRTS